MSHRQRRFAFERLDARHMLSAVAIPTDLTVEPSGQLVVPVEISDAEGVRGVEIEINYDTDLLDTDSDSIAVGSVWSGAGATVVADVDDGAGTIVIWVFAAEGLDSGSGSLVDITFTAAGDAAVGTSTEIDLAEVVLNEKEISVDPEPQPGEDSTDGQITLVDSDGAPGITVTPTSGLATSEAGATAEFTVVLNSEPEGDVVIAIASNDTTEGTVSVSQLRFTSDNWNEPQTVTITGVDDAWDDGDSLYTIVTAAAVSSDTDYNGLDAADVSVTNEDDETFTSTDLGEVDFTRLESLNPSDGDLWFRVEAARDAWLTLLATDAWTSAELSISLFGLETPGEAVAVSQLQDGAPRLDYEVQEGETYLLRITGSASDVSLLLANLVYEDGTAITVYGTDGDDEFTFDASTSRDITINGVDYQYENAEFASVSFDGGDGQDLVWFYDSSGDETLEAWSDHATVTNGAGDGVWNFTVEVAGIEELQAYAKNGGTDSAIFHGSENADKFKSYEDSVRLRAANSAYQLRAKFFDTVVGDGGSGGSDTAVFNNGEGADTFTYDGADGLARLQGTDRDHTASGFTSVVVRSESGDGDVASLTDDPDEGNVVYFRSHKTVLATESVKVTVRLFDEVHATASGDGFNVARFYDTSGDDLFVVAGDTAQLYESSGSKLDLLYEASGFDRVKAYSSSGGDDTTDIGENSLDLYLYGWDE